MTAHMKHPKHVYKKNTNVSRLCMTQLKTCASDTSIGCLDPLFGRIYTCRQLTHALQRTVMSCLCVQSHYKCLWLYYVEFTSID